MAKGRAWGRISALLSITGGAFLLFLVLAEHRPQAEPEKPVETAEAEEPEPLEPEEALKAVLAAVTLPPPPMPEEPAPEPETAVPEAPEPLVVKVDPPRQQPPEPKAEPEPQPEPEPVHTIKPLKAEVVERRPAPEPEPEPVHTIKPLKVTEPAPKPEPLEPAKPLKPLERIDKDPEPELQVKPLRPTDPKPRLKPVEPPVVEQERPIEPLRPEPRPQEVVEERPVEASPAPAPEPKPQTVEVSVNTTGEVAKEGRALLRLLEHGSGPTIEIAWPRDSRQRQTLYRTLAGCFGMKPILMDGSGNLFTREGARGQKWEINLDRFSGFVRQPAGFVAAEERGEADAIRRYHGLRFGTNIVRIFPRRVDAVLLGGLQQILGDGYRRARNIHGTYRQIGDKLFVEEIVADGVPVAGRIAFASRRRCSI